MKVQKICAVIAAILLLTGCGPAGGANPGETVKPDAAPTEAQPAATPDPAEEPSRPGETSVPGENPGEPEKLWTLSDHFCADGPLQPWEGYGALLPYAGAVVQLDQFYAYPFSPVYGLCTSQGQLVTNPIYTDLRYDGKFLVLMQQRGADLYTTVAAQDGSWVGEETLYTYEKTFGEFAVLMDSSGGLHIWNSQGERCRDFPAEAVAPCLENRPDYNWWVWDPLLVGIQDHVLYVRCAGPDGADPEAAFQWFYLDLDSGAVLDTPPAGYPESMEQREESVRTLPDGMNGYECFDPFTGTMYYKAYVDMSTLVYDAAGSLLIREDWNVTGPLACPVMDGLLAVQSPYAVEGAYDVVFDWVEASTGELVFRYQPERQYQ